jgi:hypothetical protein
MELDDPGFDGVGHLLEQTAAHKKFDRDDGEFKKLVPDFCDEDKSVYPPARPLFDPMPGNFSPFSLPPLTFAF